MIGVVGGGNADALLTAIRSADGTVMTTTSTAAVDAEYPLVIALGGRALVDLVAAGRTAPVLPIDAPTGPHSITRDHAVEAASTLVEGAYATERVPLLSVGVDGTPIGVPALYEATFRTEEPARISEYSITAGETRDRFRADGVVIATPIGSSGYARAAGGPTVDPSASALAALPIAAFAPGTGRPVVASEDGFTVVVERDEAAISLDLDGRPVGRVPVGIPVEIEVTDTLETVVLEGDGTETL